MCDDFFGGGVNGFGFGGFGGFGAFGGGFETGVHIPGVIRPDRLAPGFNRFFNPFIRRFNNGHNHRCCCPCPPSHCNPCHPHNHGVALSSNEGFEYGYAFGRGISSQNALRF